MICAIVVAAGSGTRFGGRKQFIEVAGRSVVAWSIAACRSVASQVVVVVPADITPEDLPADLQADVVVVGGATRADSVRAGLASVHPHATCIVVHDAARPVAGAALFHAVTEAIAQGAAAAICATDVTDTVKVVARRDGRSIVVDTLDRSSLVAVQTPQAFTPEILRAAHASGGDATDDAGLVEALGETVVVVPGSPSNVKITNASDLDLIRASLS